MEQEEVSVKTEEPIKFIFWLDEILEKAAYLKVFRGVSIPTWLGATALFLISIFTILCALIFDQKVLIFCLSSFLLSYILYETVFRALKKLFFKITSRSFLQDFLLFVVPLYFLIAYLLRTDCGIAADYLALVAPAFLSVYRIGCFLRGCCHGVPSHRYGVFYPYLIVLRRVFPIQLVESIFSAFLFLFILSKFDINHSNGSLFIYFLFIYSNYRFFSDFFRRRSCRPRYGKFSEAQCICLGIIGILVFIKYF